MRSDYTVSSVLSVQMLLEEYNAEKPNDERAPLVFFFSRKGLKAMGHNTLQEKKLRSATCITTPRNLVERLQEIRAPTQNYEITRTVNTKVEYVTRLEFMT
jgi:hypothetical protein